MTDTDRLRPAVVVLDPEGAVVCEIPLREAVEMLGHARAVALAALAGWPEAAAVVRAAVESAEDPELPPCERGRGVVGACLLHCAVEEIGS